MIKKNQSIQSAAQSFFGYLGTCLPYLCASDEFYFLPRSERAVANLGALDDLKPDRIEEMLTTVARQASALPLEEPDNLEDRIDRMTLKKSMDRFIWEFGSLRTWQKDPTLYVKIPLFAIDEIMSRDAASAEERREALWGILNGIPSFLQQGLANLLRPSALSVDVASRMALDALHFFHHDIPLFIYEEVNQDPALLDLNRQAQAAWGLYKEGLQRVETDGSFLAGTEGLTQILAVGVDYPKSPAQVLAMAEHGFRSTLAKIRALAEKIDPRTPWQEQVKDAVVFERSAGDIVNWYQEEVRNLREFFYAHDVLTFPKREQVEVRPTPSYLQSLRATASYRAALTGRPDDTGVFYITPGPAMSGLVLSHKAYLSAHETYPGHHVLDTIRIRHPNPIRRQIESPLFYEGWATYAESLLDDFGYTKDPRQKLAQLQRQIWRDLRAVLDVKVHTGAMSMEDAARQIQTIGFSADTATRQVVRFALTPGYQSCYFLGMREIVHLKDRFAGRVGLRDFHDTLLSGGQLSFDLVEKRLEAAFYS